MAGSRPDNPNWYRLTLRTRNADADGIGALLISLGAAGTEAVDADHPAPPADLDTGTVEIRAWFGRHPAEAGLLERIGTGIQRILDELGGQLLDGPRVEPVTSADWADNWRRHFTPVRAGRFYIHPGWRRPPAGERFAVRIDPGMAFGTGLHPTTRLCLAAIDRLLPADSMLDVGCGSGILSLAAARAGVPRVVALDCDPQAIEATRLNCRLNRLEDPVRVIRGEIDLVQGRHRLVAANILSSVLAEIAPRLPARIQPGGHLLLSGLMREERDELLAVYARYGFDPADQDEMDDWSLLHLTWKGKV